MNKIEYAKLVSKYTPSESKLHNALTAFLSGGVIGVLSVFIYQIFTMLNFNQEMSNGYTILILILLIEVLAV